MDVYTVRRPDGRDEPVFCIGYCTVIDGELVKMTAFSSNRCSGV